MEFVAQSVIWLKPEAKSPCEMFFYFRGQYAPALPADQPISPEFLQKIGKAGYTHIFIKADDQAKWEEWNQLRYGIKEKPTGPSESAKAETAKQLYGNKRAEYISYLQKSLQLKDASSKKMNEASQKAVQLISNVVKTPLLDWYFNKFHEPPDLLYHGARVTYSATLFCYLHSLLDEKLMEEFVHSMIIHEIDGDPAESTKLVVSQITIETMAKKKFPAPQPVLDLIRLQDELYSGKGFPNNLKTTQIPMQILVFSYFNLFDHYRLKATGTRRARFDLTKKKMEERFQDFQPDLWEKFWTFWETQVEAIS